jgi:hypothetical protein
MGRKAISDMLTTCKVPYTDDKVVLCWAGCKTVQLKICYHQQVASLFYTLSKLKLCLGSATNPYHLESMFCDYMLFG